MISNTTLICLLAVGLLTYPAFAADNPHFENNVLTIPHVDTPDLPGQYTDVKLHLTQAGTWLLDSYFTLGETAAYIPIESVELIVIDALPVHVLLRLKGIHPSSCSILGDISVRLENTTFNISIQNGFHQNLSDPIVCLAQVRYFQKTLALPVLGFKAGQYNYLVNKKFFGYF